MHQVFKAVDDLLWLSEASSAKTELDSAACQYVALLEQLSSIAAELFDEQPK